MSAHQMATIEEFCSDILILNKGKTVLQGNLKEIKETYPANRVEIDVKQDIKNYIKELSPEVEGYLYRVKLMNMAKSLISASAEQYRVKYELQDRLPDDMKVALNMTGTLRRIYIYLNETEEAEEQKKIYDLWKKKLDSDLKAMKK